MSREDGEVRKARPALRQVTARKFNFWTYNNSGSTGFKGGAVSKHIFLGETRLATAVNDYNEAVRGAYGTEKDHVYYYHSDHLGSAQLVTDSRGDEYQRIEYTPYGETWVDVKIQGNKELAPLSYKFSAKELDEETGFYYFGARYLDPRMSRWISADPAMNTGEYFPVAPTSDEARQHNGNLPGMGGVFNAVNFNVYHYAANNPIVYTDPDGRASTLEINGEYHVLADYTWTRAYEEIVKSSFYFGGDKILELYNWIDDLNIKHIDEDNNDDSTVSNILGGVSLVGDIKLSKFTSFLGKLASVINWFLTGKKVIKLFSKKELFAIEDFTCMYFCCELISNSHEVSSELYKYAKSKVSEMYKNGDISFEYDFWGRIKDNWKINNKDSVLKLKDDLVKMRKELEGGDE